MVVPTYLKALLGLSALLAVSGFVSGSGSGSGNGSSINQDFTINEEALRQELEALLLAEANATTSYAGRRTEPNWAVRFVRNHGYPIEIHQTKTSDGYLLTLHRIPGSKDRKKINGAPILLHHGFMGSSGDFVVLGPGKALAFILADLGYDVWMANARGTTDSRKHDTLNPSQPVFWDYSWHDIGVKDIPVEIDYVLRATKRPSLTYIGYSMGTTAFFVMGSERPEYMRKVNKMIALGPVAFMQHVQGPLLRHLAPLTVDAAKFAKLIGIRGEFAPSTTFVKWAAKKFCANRPRSQVFCSNIMFILFGFSEEFVDSNLVARISEFAPAGASIKAMSHFAQLIKHAPTFRKFDYGPNKNKQLYGSTVPPNYNTRSITCPVHLFVANNDWFATPTDTSRFKSILPNVKTLRILPRNTFTHFDFVYSRDALQQVYQQVINIVRS